MTASDILDKDFLDIRSRLLDLAAALDRIDRAAGDVTGDDRWRLIGQAIAMLGKVGGDDRTEQIQLLFSRPYSAQWRRDMELAP